MLVSTYEDKSNSVSCPGFWNEQITANQGWCQHFFDLGNFFPYSMAKQFSCINLHKNKTNNSSHKINFQNEMIIDKYLDIKELSLEQKESIWFINNEELLFDPFWSCYIRKSHERQHLVVKCVSFCQNSNQSSYIYNLEKKMLGNILMRLNIRSK